jgi:hypothetical protein
MNKISVKSTLKGIVGNIVKSITLLVGCLLLVSVYVMWCGHVFTNDHYYWEHTYPYQSTCSEISRLIFEIKDPLIAMSVVFGGIITLISAGYAVSYMINIINLLYVPTKRNVFHLNGDGIISSLTWTRTSSPWKKESGTAQIGWLADYRIHQDSISRMINTGNIYLELGTSIGGRKVVVLPAVKKPNEIMKELLPRFQKVEGVSLQIG